MKKLHALIAAVTLTAIPALALAQSAAPVTVKLKTGETLTGQFVERGKTSAVFHSDSVGDVTIPAAQIDSVNGAAYVPTSSPGMFGSDFLPGWTHSFDLGLNGQNGSTESLALNTGIDFATTDEITDYRSKFGARYWLTNSDGNKSQNAFRAYANYDKYLPSVDPKFFVFGYGQYDFDEFQSFENRISVFAGPGYDFVKKDDYTMSGRVGFGVTDDFGDPATDDFRFELMAGVDGKWNIEGDKQFMTYSIYYFPSLEDFNDGRIVTQVAYNAAIDRAKGIYLKAFGEHKYEFRTADTTDHNNWKYGLNILVKF
ncbi:MAG: DUF481 domain-containing protein [Tepidisphaeraceae bacterium]